MVHYLIVDVGKAGVLIIELYRSNGKRFSFLPCPLVENFFKVIRKAFVDCVEDVTIVVCQYIFITVPRVQYA